MASEVAQAYQWIETTCLADTALMAVATRVFQGMADIGTQPPFVVYARQSDRDVATLAGVRLWANMLMQIKMVGTIATYAALVAGANRIDELFKDKRNVGLPGGVGVLSSTREQQIAYDDPLVGGVRWTNLGGLYRIDLQGS